MFVRTRFELRRLCVRHSLECGFPNPVHSLRVPLSMDFE